MNCCDPRELARVEAESIKHDPAKRREFIDGMKRQRDAALERAKFYDNLIVFAETKEAEMSQ